MLYLTDHPEHTRPLLKAGQGWQRCMPEELAPGDQQLWDIFGGGALPWRCESCEHGGAGDSPRRVVLIDHAARSQFDLAVDSLKSGTPLPDRLVCLALAGSGFRGQRERSWTALRGNLHLTVHHQVRLPSSDAEAGLVMLPAIAAARTVDDLSNHQLTPQIKWVNDILVHNRKVCGVLTSTQLQGSEIRNVVFGIGMNLDRCPPITPSAAAPAPGALADFEPRLTGCLPRATELLVGHLDAAISQLLRQGSQPLYDSYRSFAGFIGRQVRIWPDQGTQNAARPIAAGRVRDLLPDLSLRIDTVASPVRKGRMELVEDTL